MSVKVKCRIILETEAALLIEQPRDGLRIAIECWIPRSQCDHISKGPLKEDYTRDATVTMAEWLADKRGFRTEEE